MLVQLGGGEEGFQFQISTLVYDELRHRSSVRWARQPYVLGRARENGLTGLEGGERLQAVGLDNDTIVISGVFHPLIAAQVGGKVGTESVDDLRILMKKMKPLLLTAASGHSMQYWVIESIDSVHSVFSKATGHVPRRQQFTVSLRYYGARVTEGTTAQ